MFTLRKSILSISTLLLTVCIMFFTSVEALADYSGYIRGTNVNVRKDHSTSSKLVATLSNKDVEIIGSWNDWFKISTGNITGWVKDDFVIKKAKSSKASNNKQVSKPASQTASTCSNKTGIIKGKNVNVRSKPAKTAKIVAAVSNKKINILTQSGDWYKISAGKTTGWVLKDFVTVSSGSTKTASSSSSKTFSSLRSKLVLSSRGYLGVRYVYGGSSPSGFDCSGFTSYIYKKNGIKIERTASAQANQGKYVSKSNLQSGDLVFFDTNGGKTKKINHAGIYIRNGKFIHASSSKKGRYVKINDLKTGFYAKAYVTGRTFTK